MIALACIVYHFCKGACSEWYASDVAVCDVCVCVSCVCAEAATQLLTKMLGSLAGSPHLVSSEMNI